MTHDPPCSFFDLSWLAVPGGEAEGVARILGLSDPVPVRWLQGLHAVQGDYWDFEADISSQHSRLFLTPQLDGWLFAMGGWIGGSPSHGVREVAEGCRLLSSLYGRAYAFTTQGRMDYYSWTLAEEGVLKRLFVWNGSPEVDEGAPSKLEAELVEAARAESYALGIIEEEDWGPNESLVMAIARAFSLDVASLGPSTKVEGGGFLFKTDVGREKGTPRRPLCSCRPGSTECG